MRALAVIHRAGLCISRRAAETPECLFILALGSIPCPASLPSPVTQPHPLRPDLLQFSCTADPALVSVSPRLDSCRNSSNGNSSPASSLQDRRCWSR